MTNACLTHLLQSPCDLPASFLTLTINLLTEHLAELPPTSLQPLIVTLLTLCSITDTTEEVRLSVSNLLLKMEL